MFGMPIENYYCISVCLKLGNCYIDMKAMECKDPFWIVSDVNDKSKGAGAKNAKFKVVKNGVHFIYSRSNELNASPSNSE